MTQGLGLIADIGATNARFALSEGGEYREERVFKCVDYPRLEDAAQAYLDQLGGPHVTGGALAVAGPVTDDLVSMTNHPWSFSIAGAQRALNLQHLTVMNDFRAIALGVPHLKPEQMRQVGPSVITPTPGAPIGIIGPGTGLGVASLVWDGARYLPVSGEGGHVTMSARTQREFDVLKALYQKYRHISAERVCSGKGLVNIYNALRSLEGRDDLPDRTPEEISAAAVSKTCPICVEALEMMIAFLGVVAGNLALTLGAFGGIYLAGGICLQLGEAFFHSRFRQEFEAKGRFDAYLQNVPTILILHPYVALLGLAAEMRDCPA